MMLSMLTWKLLQRQQNIRLMPFYNETGHHLQDPRKKGIYRLEEERAQGTVETLLVLGLAITAAVTVGYFLKSFVTKELQPKVVERT